MTWAVLVFAWMCGFEPVYMIPLPLEACLSLAADKRGSPGSLDGPLLQFLSPHGDSSQVSIPPNLLCMTTDALPLLPCRVMFGDWQ